MKINGGIRNEMNSKKNEMLLLLIVSEAIKLHYWCLVSFFISTNLCCSCLMWYSLMKFYWNIVKWEEDIFFRDDEVVFITSSLLIITRMYVRGFFITTIQWQWALLKFFNKIISDKFNLPWKCPSIKKLSFYNHTHT